MLNLPNLPPGRPRRSPSTLTPLFVALAMLVSAAPAAANPGPGVVMAMAPPDPQGGKGQFTGLLGTPHAYEGKIRPVILGFRAVDRITPWLFISLELEANPLPGDDRLYGANAAGPTFLAGKPLTKGPRAVFAPRAGFDGHSVEAWAVHLGMHILLDGPLAWDGALRGFVGPRYTYHRELDGRGNEGDPQLVTHYGMVTAGMTAHLASRFDLTVTATVPLFRVDMAELTDRTLSPLAPTAAVQFTVHAGPLPEGRAVVPAPAAAGSAAVEP
jgi:hypothetical protein